MRLRLALVLAALALSACRTAVAAVTKTEEGEKTYYVDKECTVRDYAAATDVPDGAKNLGLVRVPKEATDEETYLKLREAICAKGGDGLSQLRWVLELGKYNGPPTELEANAWSLP
jgi:hypothetical protein